MENRVQTGITASAAGILAALFIWRSLSGTASLLGIFTGAALCVLFVFFIIAFVSGTGSFFNADMPLSPDLALGERSLRRARRHSWAEIVMFMLLTRIFIYIAAYIAYYAASDAYPGGLFDTLRSVWIRSDANSYLGISERWYVTVGDPRFHIVFFPLYPILAAPLNLITNSSFASALIVSNVSAFVAAILTYETAALDMERSAALRAVKYMFILPAAFFFAAPMTESLFLALTLASVYLIRTQKWLLGCIFGALAAFTRSVGGLIIVFAGMEWLNLLLRDRRAGTLSGNKKAHILRALCMLIIPLGLVAYLYINYAVTGSAFTFMKYQSEHWGQGFGFFFESVATQAEYFVYALNRAEVTKALGLWLPNIIYTFSALGVVTKAVRAKKLRASYAAYFIAYFIVACGATWLLSSPRYLTACFPLAFSLAALTDSRRNDAALTLTSLALLILYLALFANGQYVY